MADDGITDMRLAPELADLARAWLPGQFARLEVAAIPAARAEHQAMLRSRPPVADERVDWSDSLIDGAGDRQIPVRLYQPRDRAAACSALVYCHGGAFAMGNPESEHRRTLALAGDLGIVVVSVDYRLAPEHPYPAGLDDCYAALEWTAREASRLGIDSRRLAVGGASAGGALAAGLALRARDTGGPPLAGQFLICPVLDDRLTSHSMAALKNAPVFGRADAAHMWRLYLPNGSTQAESYAAPARATNLEYLPRAYIMTAEYDPLRDEAIEYALRLLQSGVSVELHNVAGAVHGFDVLADGPLARAAARAQADGLHRLLG